MIAEIVGFIVVVVVVVVLVSCSAGRTAFGWKRRWITAAMGQRWFGRRTCVAQYAFGAVRRAQVFVG